ncbi:MAG TPA: tRNA pseudouridine(38-40) synthase TruA [Gammaproteobacteria bacterium]|nr:tRNA pseudouridine(38-40) synthase TruA [Gammaproteobacteria bacterium]
MRSDNPAFRFAAGVEYDGANFSGWQRQRHARSVQGDVEAALSMVADQPVEIVCAGRTDAGVHAEGQVIHFNTDARRTTRSWLLGANSNLQADGVLRWLRLAPAGFHARFSARARHYRYTILNRETRPAIGRHYLAAERRPLDVEAMRQGARALIGEHDFSAFRAAECQAASPVRRVVWLTVERHGERIEIDVVANAFLHHMVRNIAGVLIAIGAGRQPPAWAEAVLAGHDRAAGGVTAPAGGLRFMGVLYPDEFDMPLGPESRLVFGAIAKSVNL